MAIALTIVSGVLLLAILVIVVLAAALMMVVEENRAWDEPTIDIPPIKWDYSRETGWVDADVEAADE